MANNIKIVGNITDITTVSRYSPNDVRLIASEQIQESFGFPNDYIEYYVYDVGGNLLYRNYDYEKYKLASNSGYVPAYEPSPNINGSVENTTVGVDSVFFTASATLPIIEIDPVADLQSLGYSSGEFVIQYNFFENKISNSTAGLFIKEISSDRTEIRVGSTVLSNEEIESSVTSLINTSTGSVYFTDYVLNFGNNKQVLAVNIALNVTEPSYEIFFKLYEPLPTDIVEKTSFWVVKEKVSPYVFDINLDKLIIPAPPIQLRGPNFDVEIKEQNTVATPYQNYNNLLLNLQGSESSSYRYLLNLITSQSIQINVDYTDFSNFIFFSSAEARITNFYNKVKQIEDYSNLITLYTPYILTTSSLQTETNRASSSIDNIVANFDKFESYLYFTSASSTVSSTYAIDPYPKSGSLKPYKLLSTGSISASAWYTTALTSSQNYDLYNVNNLKYSVPGYIVDDPDNSQYLVFLSMVGHYFDNIWIVLKAVTDINLANNNLNKGISKDLVYNMLQSLGANVFNSFSNDNLNNYLIGANSGSAFLSGYLTDVSATSSYLNNIPRQDLLAESYKRIYHNLPLLLKSKGTTSGLGTLISVFGIPSKTYITGSAISSSILNVKEFGGSLKKDIITGYSTDKVRVVTNTITGSVLSSYISLQIYSSESSKFRNADEHYVDISFSPQNQIDTYISKSISASNPSWIIDDYIGDPGYLYSSSYADLDTQKNIYFSQGTGSYAGFTGSLMDYNGFIRLIQYFDNSLFKMLENYVPARTSLSTGVTINSPVLERNKIAYANPSNTTNQTVNTATYSIASMSAQYGSFYNFLSGNKSPFFTGELSGSTVDVDQYYAFENPYLGDWSVYNSQRSIYESININTFLHSDFNVLLNNVSRSVDSIFRQKVEPIYGTTSSIFTAAELQDSYLSLTAYNNSRYQGIQVSSLLYNTYTSASDTYSGDSSFGKTAAIDHNVRKIGLFTQIESSSFLPKRNIVALKYLVDEFGGVTDLNQQNNHWEEVQNTFVLGDSATIALFDNQKFATNQKFTDGAKNIFESGYSYNPVLYFNACASTSKIYFINENGFNSNLATADNTSPYIVSGSVDPNYPITDSYVNNIFNNTTEGSEYFTAGTTIAPPTYSVQESGDHSAIISLGFNASVSPAATASIVTGSLELYKNSTTLLARDTVTFDLTYTPTIVGFTSPTASNTIYAYTSSIQYASTAISTNPIIINGTTYPAGTTFLKWNTKNVNFYSGSAGSCSTLTGRMPFFLYSLGNSSFTGIQICPTGSGTYEFATDGFFQIPNFDTPAGVTSGSYTFSINKPSNDPLTGLIPGDQLMIRLNISSSNTNFTASISKGNLSISSLAASTGYASTICSYFQTSSLASGSNTITFSTAVSNFINSGYLFVPNPVTGSINGLYSTYGDVNYPLEINPNDIILAQLSDNTYVESRVISVDQSSSTTVITLNIILSSLYVNNLINGTYQKFLILSRRKDETNMYVIFPKGTGQTSYGFIIPKDLATDVLGNIDTITKEIKQKLLSDQQGII
jgi:hypothetical protein